MRSLSLLAATFLASTLAACAGEGSGAGGAGAGVNDPVNRAPPPAEASGLTVYPRVGSDQDDAIRPSGPGLVLIGGARPVDDAFVWAQQTLSGGRVIAGDVVVLRVTGDDSYSGYLAGLAGFNSVQTLRVALSSSAADFALAADIVARAEVVFFAEEDAESFLRWRGTPVIDAIQGVYTRGGIVAGLGDASSLFGGFSFDAVAAAGATVATPDALANPYEKAMVFAPSMFQFPQLEGLLVDPRFRDDDRFGRLSAFMARQVADGVLTTNPPRVFGIGVDDGSAVVIDRFARVTLFQQPNAIGGAYVLAAGTPQQIQPGLPLIYPDISVSRLDSPQMQYDLGFACGDAFSYPVSVTGGAAQIYAPANPYEAPGVANHCTP